MIRVRETIRRGEEPFAKTSRAPSPMLPLAGRMPVPGLADLRWAVTEAVAGAGAVVLLGALAFAATIVTMLHHLVPCPLRPVTRAL